MVIILNTKIALTSPAGVAIGVRAIARAQIELRPSYPLGGSMNRPSHDHDPLHPLPAMTTFDPLGPDRSGGHPFRQVDFNLEEESIALRAANLSD